MPKNNIEDFYPLAPMQQGMLFHSMYAPESGAYVEQTSCVLKGDLDVQAFEHAWQKVLDRHPILRTAFVGEELKEPVQVVHRQVKLLLDHQDWRDLSRGEQEERLDLWLLSERHRDFDMARTCPLNKTESTVNPPSLSLIRTLFG